MKLFNTFTKILLTIPLITTSAHGMLTATTHNNELRQRASETDLVLEIKKNIAPAIQTMEDNRTNKNRVLLKKTLQCLEDRALCPDDFNPLFAQRYAHAKVDRHCLCAGVTDCCFMYGCPPCAALTLWIITNHIKHG